MPGSCCYCVSTECFAVIRKWQLTDTRKRATQTSIFSRVGSYRINFGDEGLLFCCCSFLVWSWTNLLLSCYSTDPVTENFVLFQLKLFICLKPTSVVWLCGGKGRWLCSHVKMLSQHFRKANKVESRQKLENLLKSVENFYQPTNSASQIVKTWV